MTPEERKLLADALRTLAEVGLSMRDAGTVLGMTRGQVASYSSRADVHFAAPERRTGGGHSESARRGWETRRAQGWEWKRAVSPVRHLG